MLIQVGRCKFEFVRMHRGLFYLEAPFVGVASLGYSNGFYFDRTSPKEIRELAAKRTAELKAQYGYD